MTPRFALFYRDEVILDDGEDVEVTLTVPRKWLDAPVDGVQAVVAHLPDGKLRVYDSRDVYATLPNGDPMATDDIGPQVRELGWVKYGLWIPNGEYEKVRKRIQAYRKEHEGRCAAG